MPPRPTEPNKQRPRAAAAHLRGAGPSPARAGRGQQNRRPRELRTSTGLSTDRHVSTDDLSSLLNCPSTTTGHDIPPEPCATAARGSGSTRQTTINPQWFRAVRSRRRDRGGDPTDRLRSAIRGTIHSWCQARPRWMAAVAFESVRDNAKPAITSSALGLLVLASLSALPGGGYLTGGASR